MTHVAAEGHGLSVLDRQEFPLNFFLRDAELGG
jgi:hypothetical protein